MSRVFPRIFMWVYDLLKLISAAASLELTDSRAFNRSDDQLRRGGSYITLSDVNDKVILSGYGPSDLKAGACRSGGLCVGTFDKARCDPNPVPTIKLAYQRTNAKLRHRK
jgi:hypothetical protein